MKTDPREAQPHSYPSHVYCRERAFNPSPCAHPNEELRRELERIIDAAGIPLARAPIHWTGRTNGGGAVRFLLHEGTIYHADPTPAPSSVRSDLAHITHVSIDSRGGEGGVFVSRRFAA